MIPTWNLQGVIPPTRPGVQGHDPDRSPYLSTLHAFISAMGTSPARLEIIEGLLKFRTEIHKLGVKSGFQWLNGSFSENVEDTEARDPRDVDVVTFLQIPKGENNASIVRKNPELFDSDYVKQMYRVDSNWQILGEPMEASSVRWISYWYSMWSHRRDGLWKGFVQLDLDSAQDPAALQLLTQAQADLGVVP